MIGVLYDPKREQGGVRQLKARWTITCTLKMLTSAQIGSHAAANCDQTYGRDEDGNATLHGSTLAGALRNALNDWLTGYFSEEHKDTSLLLGYVDVKNTSGSRAEAVSNRSHKGRREQESPLIVFDAVATEHTSKSTIRDGVRIDVRTGLAADKKKYDRELTLPDVEFPLRFDLLVAENADEDRLLYLLGIALNALTNQQIALGARKRRGLGRCLAYDFRAHRYNLKSTAGWLAYLSSSHTEPLKALSAKDSFGTAIEQSLVEAGLKPWKGADDDRRHTFHLDFDLNVSSTLLIRSPGIHADDPDMVHLTELGRAILSGTSLAGALRNHCVRLLNTLGDFAGSDAKRDGFMDGLFGSDPDRMKAPNKIRASRVIVSECAVEKDALGQTPVRYVQTRLKIDRFTGGPIDGALFDQVPVAGGKVVFTIDVQNPSDVDIALLLLAVRDLTEGLLPVGGEASIGRGVLKGTAKVTLPAAISSQSTMPTRPDASQIHELTEPIRLTPERRVFTLVDGSCEPDEAAALQPYLNALAAFIASSHTAMDNASATTEIRT